MQTPRTEFAQALRAVATERGLDADVILDTIRQAIIAAYKRDAKERGEDVEELEFEVELNSTSGEAKIFAWPAPPDVDQDEENADQDEPKEKPKKKPVKKKDVTPPGFGRIAAQTAKQVIHQKIREAEKGAIMDEFSDKVGSLMSGTILRFDGSDVRVDLGRTEGIMPADERIPSERLNSSQRLTFLLKDIVEGPKGKRIILSRADSEFVEKLFKREVPEMNSGSVEVKAIAREAGVRTKIAVFSNQSGVDPVGSCVGQKGVRVQAVTNELGGERIDIIPHTDDEGGFVEAALSPADGLTVTLDEKSKVATVDAPEDQLSLAIGREGQNVRLAAKLTGWKIKINEKKSEKKTAKLETSVSGRKTKKTKKKKKDEDTKKKGKKKKDKKKKKAKKSKKATKVKGDSKKS